MTPSSNITRKQERRPVKDGLDGSRTPIPLEKLSTRIKAEWVFNFLKRAHYYKPNSIVNLDENFIRTIWRANWDLLDLNYIWDRSLEEDGKDGREDIPANQTVESMRNKFGKDTAIFNIDLVVQVISEVEWQTCLDCTKDDLYIDPRDAFDFLTRSHARMLHGDLVGALDDINRAIEIDPENRDARMNRAELLVSLGIYDPIIL